MKTSMLLQNMCKGCFRMRMDDFLLLMTGNLSTCFWDNNSCRLVLFATLSPRVSHFLVALIFHSIRNHDLIGRVIDLSALKYHSLYLLINQYSTIFFGFPAWPILEIFLINKVKFLLRRFTN